MQPFNYIITDEQHNQPTIIYSKSYSVNICTTYLFQTQKLPLRSCSVHKWSNNVAMNNISIKLSPWNYDIPDGNCSYTIINVIKAHCVMRTIVDFHVYRIENKEERCSMSEDLRISWKLKEPLVNTFVLIYFRSKLRILLKGYADV